MYSGCGYGMGVAFIGPLFEFRPLTRPFPLFCLSKPLLFSVWPSWKLDSYALYWFKSRRSPPGLESWPDPPKLYPVVLGDCSYLFAL